jgi:hypothetical protein
VPDEATDVEDGPGGLVGIGPPLPGGVAAMVVVEDWLIDPVVLGVELLGREP